IILMYVFGALGTGLVFAFGRLAGQDIGALAALGTGLVVAWLMIFVLCGYGVTTPAVVLEDLSSSFEAFGRSWDLTGGARLKVFGTAAVMWIIAKAIPFIVFFGLSFKLGPATQP